MQILPAFDQSSGSSDLANALGGNAALGDGTASSGLWGKGSVLNKSKVGKSALQKAGKGLNFASALENLQDDLKGLNLKEFNAKNTPGIAPGFASSKDDKSLLKTRDLNYLEGKLRQGGVDEDVLQNFMSGLYSGTDIPGVGRIMGAARNMGKSGDVLDDQEKIALSGLMQRIGYSSEEIAEMEELAYQGKGLKVLEKVEKRIEQLTDPSFRENLSRQLASASEKLQGKAENLQGLQGQAENAAASGKQANSTAGAATLLADILHVTKEELSAMSKAFNLSDKASAQLMNVFGDQAEADINAKDFSKLFGNAKAELNRDEAAFAKLREVAPAAIKDMLNNAKTVATNEADVDNRVSRKQQRSEILMRDKLTQAKDGDEDGNSAAQRKSMLSELTAKADQSAVDRNISENLRNSQNPRQAGDKETDGKDSRHSNQDGRREFSDTLKQDNDRAFARTASENAALSGREILASRTDGAAGAIFSFAQPNAAASNGANGANSTGADPRAATYNERIFEQVEQGILRNAMDGSRQITMRLDPPDLGRLTLNLTVANGEVKATIRTEQAEVTRMVTEQVAALKASLEEQGFKVTSLEVETRAQSEPGMENWNSAEQHNKEQEQEARANFLRLSRNRAKEGDTLDQNMQSGDQPATISETGLHLVA